MAVYLVGIDGETAGVRLELRAGTFWLGCPEGRPVLLGEAIPEGSARLEVSRQAIVLFPGQSMAVAVNDQMVADPTALRPGDRISLGGVTLRLDVGAPSPITVEPAAVALPPPDAPWWRTALLLFAGAALLALVVLAVIRYAPRPAPDPVALMPDEARQKVKAATVWVRVRLPDAESEGSGYVAKPGYVITNAHVVEGGQSIEVVFNCGQPNYRRAPAKVLRTGEPGTPTDLALLQVDTGRTPHLPLADLSKIVEGTPVALFGFPLGANLSTSSHGPQISVRGGRITALRPDDRGRVLWVESDIAAEVGNSGGPVVTHQGEVVGLGTMLVGPHLKTFLAAPANLIRTFAPEVAG